jgi:hypothetical protein
MPASKTDDPGNKARGEVKGKPETSPTEMLNKVETVMLEKTTPSTTEGVPNAPLNPIKKITIKVDGKPFHIKSVCWNPNLRRQVLS